MEARTEQSPQRTRGAATGHAHAHGCHFYPQTCAPHAASLPVPVPAKAAFRGGPHLGGRRSADAARAHL